MKTAKSETKRQNKKYDKQQKIVCDQYYQNTVQFKYSNVNLCPKFTTDKIKFELFLLLFYKISAF